MGKMLGSRAAVTGLAVLVAMMLIGSDSGFGQEKKKISWTAKDENTKVTFRQRFEIPDVTGHGVAFFEIRRVWPDGGGPVVEGLKVVEEIAWGMGDGVFGNGFDRGYSVVRYENGDQLFSQWQDTYQSVINPDGSRKATVLGTYLNTGGTGKLKGIKGVGRFSGVVESDPQVKPTRIEYSAEGEYWFEK
jgi:hypothetical protein